MCLLWRTGQYSISKGIIILVLSFSLFGSVETRSQTTIMLTPAKDNSIFSENANSNALGDLYAGRAGAMVSGATRRTLLQFDLSAIPVDATVTSVTLMLTKNKGGALTTIPSTLHKLLALWGEGTSIDDVEAGGGQGGGNGAAATNDDATWIYRLFDSETWTVAGGQFQVTPSASTIVNSTNGLYSWTDAGMISDVQSWVQNPTENFGWILKGDESVQSTAARYNSREDTSGKPTLVIQYTVCLANLNLTGSIPSGTYEAQSITSGGMIGNGTIVFFKATNVDLLGNFTLNLGGQLNITLDGCSGL